MSACLMTKSDQYACVAKLIPLDWSFIFCFLTQYTVNISFMKKIILCILCVGTATAPRGIVICHVRTNKTSNSTPSGIKGYLDRNINISLKSNQMLLHGGAQDWEQGERKTEKQGRYFTQESESVPRPQHSETFIPPSPWPLPPNLERGDILEETRKKSHPAWIWFSVASHMKPREACQREATQPLHAQERRSNHRTNKLSAWLACWSRTHYSKPQRERKAVQFPLGCKYDLIWLKLAMIKTVTQFRKIQIL